MTSRRSRSEATGAARSEQLGRAQVLSKRPREGDIREQRPNARGAGRAGCRLARARVRAEGLYQQDQPVNQLEHVCVERCPLTMKHVAKRSGDSCGSERRSHPRAKTTLTELWRGRDPEAEAGSRTTAGRSGNSCRSQSSQALEPRSHPHSGPQQGADQRGWRREATEERPPCSAPGGETSGAGQSSRTHSTTPTRAAELWRETLCTRSAWKGDRMELGIPGPRRTRGSARGRARDSST